MAQSNSWRRSSFTEICNANRVTLFKSEATDWLSLYHLISITFLINSLLDLYVQHVLSIRITFILSIKYWLYTWSKQSNQTHCQLNSQEFSKRIISFFRYTIVTNLERWNDGKINSLHETKWRSSVPPLSVWDVYFTTSWFQIVHSHFINISNSKTIKLWSIGIPHFVHITQVEYCYKSRTYGLFRHCLVFIFSFINKYETRRRNL